MVEQPYVRPLAEEAFFSNSQGARIPPAHTVARGQLREEGWYYSGKIGDRYVTELPAPATRELLVRGRERFNIFCAECHDQSGQGNGMIIQRGFPKPPSYTEQRLRNAPLGYFVAVITQGYGVMFSYASRVPPEDRWAIAAYIRALQLSQYAPVADAEPHVVTQLEKEESAP